MKLHLAGVLYESIADAEGVAATIFFSGCDHHCKGCHSPQTWDYTYGTEATDGIINMIRSEIIKRPFVKTIVLSGGDPFCSATEVLDFLDKLNLPNYTIWAYTGYRMLDLFMSVDDKCKLLDKCDYLVDGPFEIDKRDITLKFRGSSNQHIYYHDHEHGRWEMKE